MTSIVRIVTIALIVLAACQSAYALITGSAKIQVNQSKDPPGPG